MNNFKKIFLAAVLFFQGSIFTKKIVRMNDVSLYEQWTQHQSWFKITPLAKILTKYPEIKYQSYFGELPFNFKPFPLSLKFPYAGSFKECFILEIPRGQVQA